MPLVRKIPAVVLLLTLTAAFCVSLAGRAESHEFQPYSKILWGYLETLVGFGPRNPGSGGYVRTARLIKSVGRDTADQVIEHAFNLHRKGDEILQFTNIELRFNGTKGGQPILVGAHYDTRPFADEESDPALQSQPILGANDGGSGTAVLLGLARYLKENRPGRPVHLMFFDGEDFGAKGSGETLIGSNYHARQLGKRDPKDWPHSVLIVDMVGDRELEIYKETFSMKNAHWLLDVIYDKAEEHRLTQFKRKSKHTLYDDHYPFIKLGIPSAVLIDFDYPHWHKLSDTLDKCSPESLLAVFTVVAEVLGEL
ncbi:MAG: M28 family peptidase [Nitrospinaceae bacterium]